MVKSTQKGWYLFSSEAFGAIWCYAVKTPFRQKPGKRSFFDSTFPEATWYNFLEVSQFSIDLNISEVYGKLPKNTIIWNVRGHPVTVTVTVIVTVTVSFEVPRWNVGPSTYIGTPKKIAGKKVNVKFFTVDPYFWVMFFAGISKGGENSTYC